MYYDNYDADGIDIDTRRDSSLISTRETTDITSAYINQASPVEVPRWRAAGSVQRELITSLFESMLHNTVESWHSTSKAREEPTLRLKTASDSKSKKRRQLTPASSSSRSSKMQMSKTSLQSNNKTLKTLKKSQTSINPTSEVRNGLPSNPPVSMPPVDPMEVVWWSTPNEKAVIMFKNGNKYKGDISNKVMHGVGRYEWTDGTVYVGEFKDNKITGRGKIYWPDDSWYEGGFDGNIRHGEGTFVDSRRQRAYLGTWHQGTKHGKGHMFYSYNNNSYDGEWWHNIRNGFGIQEYCKLSGYRGQWDMSVRHGKGLMIWPNHDLYVGGWKNGVMCDFGSYIWTTPFNGSLCMPTINSYYGTWLDGKRYGHGNLELGDGLGSFYQGGFKNNTKDGAGSIVNRNGTIVHDEHLFEDDQETEKWNEIDNKDEDEALGLDSHIQMAVEYLDQINVQTFIIDEYLKLNKTATQIKLNKITKSEEAELDFIVNEKHHLNRALKNYTATLNNIYKTYATMMCNTEQVDFDPVMIRLYVWQFYYDCNVHQKGLTLVDIDRVFHENSEWLSRRPHDPYEPIYFWQFLHILISTTSKLYADWTSLGSSTKPVFAGALSKFMKEDALPSVGLFRGHLRYVSYLPLRGLYEFYRSFGKPHTIRKFLCAVRLSPLLIDRPQPELVEASEDSVPHGRNAFIIGDKIEFIKDSVPYKLSVPCSIYTKPADLKLYNFGNLSAHTILQIVGTVFPAVYQENQVLDIDVEINFFEFIQLFVGCAKESVRVSEK